MHNLSTLNIVRIQKKTYCACVSKTARMLSTNMVGWGGRKLEKGKCGWCLKSGDRVANCNGTKKPTNLLASFYIRNTRSLLDIV